MAFRSRAGIKSGLCINCLKIRNKDGECRCTTGDGSASCMGCGATGFVPDKKAPEMELRKKIGCNCGSGS
jgi:hypothetical protein